MKGEILEEVCFILEAFCFKLIEERLFEGVKLEVWDGDGWLGGV